MKKTIEGIEYDTETAEEIKSTLFTKNIGLSRYTSESLYKAPSGQYFMVRTIPLAAEDAKIYCRNYDIKHEVIDTDTSIT